MIHVAKEMQRQGFSIPLMIGGATTSRAHTAVKISQYYSGGVVHVLDASRAVNVASSLLSPEQKPAFLANLESDYEKLRVEHSGRQAGKPMLSLEDAIAKAPKLSHEEIAVPEQTGVVVFESAKPAPEFPRRIGGLEFASDSELKQSHSYANLIRKAKNDAAHLSKDIRSLVAAKAAALRGVARAHVSGEHQAQPHAYSGGTQGSAGVDELLQVAKRQLAQIVPRIIPENHGDVDEAGSRARLLAPQRRAVSLRDLIPFIDWSPFFHTWELRGRYPAIFDDPNCGVEAKKLFDDAQKLLAEIVADDSLQLRGVCGLFPANRDGEDIVVYTDESRSEVAVRFHGLRQQMKKPEGQFNFSIADFVAPAPAKDYVGAFAVTSGHGMLELVEKFKATHDDYNVIMTEAIADRFAEAFAEYMHKFARDTWGFGKTENLTPEEIIREKYRGIRPAPGYPAQPDHTEKWAIWKLLDAERNTGITLTESLAMFPASSVSGLYFGHPESKYFAVGKIERDQIESYAQRKGMSVEEAQKWLQPYLNYNPDSQLTRPCQPGVTN